MACNTLRVSPALGQIPPRARENIAALGRLLEQNGDDELEVGDDLIRLSAAGRDGEGNRHYSLRRLQSERVGFEIDIVLNDREVIQYAERRVSF